MILNGLPWRRTEIILSFLRLHPNTAFWTLADYEGYSISSKVLQFFNVLSNAIYNSKDMEATHVLINRQLDYKDVVCVCVCLYCNIVV